MAKSKKQKKKKIGGPFLTCATFCDAIIEEADGVLSAMKMIDTVKILLSPNAPADIPSEQNPVGIVQHLLVTFKSGDSPGKHKLQLIMEGPSGKKVEVMNKDIELSRKPHGGLNIKTQCRIAVQNSGLRWLDVVLDGKVFSRVPINIIISRTIDPTK